MKRRVSTSPIQRLQFRMMQQADGKAARFPPCLRREARGRHNPCDGGIIQASGRMNLPHGLVADGLWAGFAPQHEPDCALLGDQIGIVASTGPCHLNGPAEPVEKRGAMAFIFGIG